MDNLTTAQVLDLFRMYVGLKLHFNDKNFVFTDGFGSNKFKEESMNKRHDIDTFIRVVNTIDKSEIKSRLISGFKEDKEFWIGNLLDKGNEKYHATRLAVINALRYNIEKDLSRLESYLESNKLYLNEILKFNGDRPDIIKKRNLKCSDEFMAILDFSIDYLDQDTENPFWKKRSFSLMKYKYLIEIDEDLLNKVKEFSIKYRNKDDFTFGKSSNFWW